MKWYKHISDSLDDPFIFELMDEFGAEGYLVFFGTLEIYSREFSLKDDWKLSITWSFLRQKLRISRPKLQKILSKIYKWEVEFTDTHLIIFIPKFKDLIDNWTLRQIPKTTEQLQSYNVETTQPIRIKKKNKEEDKRVGRSFAPPSLDEIISYCQQRNNKLNSQQFLDFYTAKNWMIGKNKMKDWKAAIRTWETREGNGNGNTGFNTSKKFISERDAHNAAGADIAEQITRELREANKLAADGGSH